MSQDRWLGLDEWKRLAAEGHAPPDATLRKTYLPDEIRQLEDAPRTLRFTLSTGIVDRDRDTLDPAGWRLDAYLRNPVVLWAHSYRDLPIARTRRIGVDGGRLVADAEFAPAELNPLAETVYRMLLGGYLRAASVGFQPLEHVFNADRGGVDYRAQELLEFSIVPVPSNPDALVQLAAAGVDLTPVKRWAEGVLRDVEGHDGIWFPRKEAQEALRLIDKAKATKTSAIDQPPGDEPLDKGVIPANVSTERAPMDATWTAPTLSDFTDQRWDDLTEAQRRRIAGHFAWAATMPPERFGDLKLPHHRASDGQIIWRGVAAAMGALLGARGGVDIPEADRQRVHAHLSGHYRAFDREPPEFRIYSEEEWASVDRAYDEEGRSVVCSVPAATARPVTKFNPQVLPLERSFEWIQQRLEGVAGAYLRASAIMVSDEDHPWVVALFPDRAIVVVVGMDRPWEQDPSYEATWQAREDGEPQWVGAPRRVDVRVHTEIVQLLAAGGAQKRGRVLSGANEDRLRQAGGLIQEVLATLEEHEGQGTVGPAVTGVAGGNGDGGIVLEFDEEATLGVDAADVRAILAKVVGDIVGGDGIARSVQAAIDRARGRVD